MTQTLTAKTFAAILASAGILLMILGTQVASANHYVFPSTNDENRTNGDPHVNQVSAAIGQTVIEFVNPKNYITCFEYRTDGDTTQALVSANPNPSIHDRYPARCLTASTTQRVILASEYVEVRSVFGAERDHDFDWTQFDVLPNPDADGDGVLTGDDKCEEAADPDEFKDFGKAKGRYEWNGEEWVSAGKGDKNFTPDMDYTYGCTGTQILDIMSEATEQDFGGHYKHGLSKSILEAWHAGRYYMGTGIIDTVTVDSADVDGSDSEALEAGQDYVFRASGTADAGETIMFDVDFSSRTSVPTPWTDAVNNYEFYGDTLLDLMVDGNFVTWGDGSYHADHIYDMNFVGTGAPVNFTVYDVYYPGNVGSFTVDIIGDAYVYLW